MNLKERFSENEWGMIQEILNGGKRGSWYALANKYQIRLDGDYGQRSKSANDVWRKFTRLTNKDNSDLSTIKQTLDKNGEVVFETKKMVTEPVELHEAILEGKRIQKITVNPYGRPWVTYVTEKESVEEINKDFIFEELDKLFSHKQVEKEESKIDFNFSFSGEHLLVYTSDKHIGASIPDNSIYQNDYNKEEFERRMMYIASKISSLGSKKKLFIFDLGDALDGFNGQTTRGGHKLPQNMNNKEQFQTYLDVHKKFFDHILDNGNMYEEIYFICSANNNHGGDADYMAMKAFEIYLSKINPFIKVIVSDKFIDHLEVKDDNDLEYTLIFTHGKDDSDLKHGLPLHLNDRTENYINNYIDYHGLDTRKPIHFIKGDLHQSSTQYAKRFRYKNVGSIFGSSKWIHSNFGNTRPICDMDIIDKTSINEIRLFL